MMRPLAITFLLLLLMAAPVRAQDDEPTAAERKTIADCLDKNAGDDELKQMSACIGLVADPCPDAPGANTMTIVACQIREQKIWDDDLNDWYGEALKRLSAEPDAAAALKDAQRAWIAFRDSKCDYWEKRYEGGTFASVAAGNCMRATTGQRAIEMRAILDDLDH
jgi:uncharacterized protein YecT (DUF1311 family)